MKDKVDDMKILERDQNGKPIEVYIKGKSTFLISSRDAIYRMEKFENQPDGSSILMMRTVDRPNLPIPKNTYRMEMWKGSRSIEKGNDVHFVDFTYFDLKGYIPKTLLRLSMGSQLRKRFDEAYEKILKAKNQ